MIDVIRWENLDVVSAMGNLLIERANGIDLTRMDIHMARLIMAAFIQTQQPIERSELIRALSGISGMRVVANELRSATIDRTVARNIKDDKTYAENVAQAILNRSGSLSKAINFYGAAYIQNKEDLIEILKGKQIFGKGSILARLLGRRLRQPGWFRDGG